MQDNCLIELHSHLLPQMDDGSDSVEMSLAMLHREMEQGVGTICATPHFYAHQDSIETFCKRRAAALEKLLAAVPDGLPRIIPAAEVAFFSGISACSGLEQLCIKSTRTLMLEMPFTEWSNFQIEEVLTLILDRGFHVVLVHPERFGFSSRNRWQLRRLAQMPIGLQINAGSLLRWSSRSSALELLKAAYYPLLGSDSHNLTDRAPNLKEGRGIICRKLGKDFLRQMDENACLAIRELEWSS